MSKNSPYLRLDIGTFTDVKLVLGNGFDLACGLNSSYASFFDSQKELYKEILDYMENKSNSLPKDATAWDLMFLILSKENYKFKHYNKLDWKDVETVMKEVLVSKSDYIKFSFYNVINGLYKDDLYSNIISKYLENNVDITKQVEVYDFLYNELLRFEKRFSSFLKNQEDDEVYNENARRMLTESGLLKMKDNGKRIGLISIDTFNFTTPKIFNELPGYVSIRHINGKIG